MREIIFRSKRVDNGEWETGSLVVTRMWCSDESVFIADKMTGVYTPVDSKTVGQYTGLTDKNGTRIFEGDIVKITGFHTTAIAAVKYGSPSEKSTSWGWYFDDNDGHTYFLMSKAFCRDYNAIIIGNIHDNPELLKGE